MFDLILRDLDLLHVEHGRIIVRTGHDLAIRKGWIVAIEPAGQIPAGQAAQELILAGRLAIPGLTNCHAHTAMTLFRGLVEDTPIDRWFNQYIWPLESLLSEEDIYWGALLGLAEMIEAGVTCVADHYFAMHAVAEAVQTAGSRAVLAWTIFGAEDAASVQRLDQSAAFVQRWNGAAAGRITALLGPHSPYTCSHELLRLTAQRADALGVGVHLHLAETHAQLERSLAEYGRSPVQIARDCGLFDRPCIAAHVGHVQADDLTILRDYGVGVAVCPKTMLKLGAGLAHVPQYRAAGVTIGLGSDGPASNNTLDILEQARLLALFSKHTQADAQVLPLAEALSIAWLGGPQVLGMEEQLGVLRVGTRADIAVLRLDGLHCWPPHNLAASVLYSARASDVETVLVDGRLLMHERRLLTIDRAQVMREVSTRVARLLEQAPTSAIAVYPD